MSFMCSRLWQSRPIVHSTSLLKTHFIPEDIFERDIFERGIHAIFEDRFRGITHTLVSECQKAAVQSSGVQKNDSRVIQKSHILV